MKIVLNWEHINLLRRQKKLKSSNESVFSILLITLGAYFQQGNKLTKLMDKRTQASDISFSLYVRSSFYTKVHSGPLHLYISIFLKFNFL